MSTESRLAAAFLRVIGNPDIRLPAYGSRDTADAVAAAYDALAAALRKSRGDVIRTVQSPTGAASLADALDAEDSVSVTLTRAQLGALSRYITGEFRIEYANERLADWQTERTRSAGDCAQAIAYWTALRDAMETLVRAKEESERGSA